MFAFAKKQPEVTNLKSVITFQQFSSNTKVFTLGPLDLESLQLISSVS